MSLLKFEDKKDKIVFLVGCFATFYVALVGRVYVGELIVFFLYLTKSEIRKVRLPKPVKKINTLLKIWLASAIISDLYRGIPKIDMLKGVVSILFLMSLIPFVYWSLYDKISRWKYFFFGTVISSQLTYYLLTATTEFGSTEIWKVYSFVPLFSGIAVLFYYKGKHNLSYLTFFLFGIWMLFNGSRNVFLTSVMTVFFLYVVNKTNSNSIQTSISRYKKNAVLIFFSLAIGLSIVDVGYEYLASNHYLGEKAYEKYYLQKNSKQGLASGRLEAIMAAELIKESPIIGYGSFAKDRTNFVYNYYRTNGYEIKPGGRWDADEDSVENMLPRHSRIFGTWMWHGIGCGIFWISILLLFYRVVKSGCLLLEPRLLALSFFTLFTETWDTFFSIMSVRLVPLFFWIFCILIYEKYKSQLHTA